MKPWKFTKHIMRHMFTDYDNKTYDAGAIIVGLAVAGMFGLQVDDMMNGGHFNPRDFGFGVAALLGGFGGYKWGDARGRIASCQTGEMQQQEGNPHALG